MKISTLVVFISFVANCSFETSAAPAATYDQRQNGQLNVDIGVSNLTFVGILNSGFEEYGDYDISYEYTDFTLKPPTPRPTSPKPVEAGTSWPTVPPTSAASTVESIAEENNNSNNDNKNITAEVVTVDSDHPGSEESSELASANDNDSEQKTGGLITDFLQAAAEEIRSTPGPPEDIFSTLLGFAGGELNVKTGLTAEDPAIEKDPIADAPALVKPEESSPEESSPVVTAAPEDIEAPNEQTDPPQPSRKCSPGYARNQKGQCRRLHGRRRVPAALLPFGFRLTPRIHRHRDHQLESVEN